MAYRALAGDSSTKRDRYGALRSALWSDRAPFDAYWKELGDFLLPTRTRFWPGERNRASKRNEKIVDSTARFSARTLQSGLHAGLTSPARPWFKLTTPDPELAKFKPVKQWLHEVTERMQVVLTGTNVYNSLPICYGDLGVFGTGAIGVLEDEKDLFRCYAYPIGSYAFGLDARGVVSTFVREYQLTVRQVVETFGVVPGRRDIDWTHLSRAVHDQWDNGHYEARVDVTWIVTPNEDADERRLEAKYLPFASCHFEPGGETSSFLKESGFRSFPILGPRWDITGEDSYGTDCPGMTALGDVKQLQTMTRDEARAVKKLIDPPMLGTPELRTQKTSLLPGDITYVREVQHGLRAIHEVTLDLDHLSRIMDKVTFRIQRAFYEDLFLMLARSDDQRGAQPVTAREVAERHEEKLLALGPVLERTNDELLGPLIDRAYELMDHGGLLPVPPEQLEGVRIKAEYTSIMAEAMKLVGVVGLDRFMTTMGGIAQSYPQVADKININRVVDVYAEILGVDPGMIRTDEEADAIAQQRAEAQAEQMKAEQAAQYAGAAKDASQAQLGTGSALDAITAGATVQ